MMCSYCGERRAVNQDHVVPRCHRRKLWSEPYWKNGHWTRDFRTERGRGEIIDPSLFFLVGSCFECNIRKGARLLAPPSWADRIDELNELGIGTFRTWDGSTEALHQVVK